MLEFELVLPCYNESKSLKVLISRAISASKEAGYSSKEFQLVLVENGSQDDSSEVLEELKKTPLGDWFRKVEVNRNEGYGFGLYSGLKTATAKYVGWSHADQQCDPNDAFLALKKIKESKQPNLVVKGFRYQRNWKDQFVSRIFETFARVLIGIKVNEINAQPKVFPNLLLKEITNPPNTFAFDVYVLFKAIKAGYKIETIPVLFPPRIHGVSKWASNFFSRYKTILGMIQYLWVLRKSEASA